MVYRPQYLLLLLLHHHGGSLQACLLVHDSLLCNLPQFVWGWHQCYCCRVQLLSGSQRRWRVVFVSQVQLWCSLLACSRLQNAHHVCL